MPRTRRGFFNRKGQGMTEYIIIVALIAIAAIVVIKLFGTQIRAQFAAMTHRMAGEQNVEVDTTAADSADEEALQDRDLDTFE